MRRACILTILIPAGFAAGEPGGYWVSDLHWVFGYGSLIWKQDFPYVEARPARIGGFVRRFWQGSHDHRGTPDDPGRVVTLVASPGDVCHGRAFLVGHDVFEHLDHREKNGYKREEVEIHLPDESVAGVTYFAPRDNVAFLGEVPIAEAVAQIRRCRGESGRNIDYVLELASALRELGVDDPHVFEIERLVTSA